MANCNTDQLFTMLDEVKQSNLVEAKAKIESIFTGIDVIESKLDATIGEWADRNPMYGTLTNEQWDELYGTEEERTSLSAQLYTVLLANPHLADQIEAEIVLDTGTRAEMDLPQAAFETVNGIVKVNFAKLPESVLRKWLNKSIMWATADGNKFVEGWFKKTKLAFNLPKDVKRLDPTGAFGEMLKATDLHAETMSRNINKFMFKFEHRKYGMADVQLELERGIVFQIDNIDILDWGRPKGMNNQVEIRAAMAEWMHELFVMLTNKQAVSVGPEQASKSSIYNKGEGIYIFTKNVPTKEVYKSTGDTIFAWVNPIKLESYDPAIHGNPGENLVFKDAKGRDRYSILDFFKKNVDLDSKAITRLEEIVEAGKVVFSDAGDFIIEGMASTANDIVSELGNWFPDVDSETIRDFFGLREYDDFGFSTSLSVIDVLEKRGISMSNDKIAEMQEMVNYLEDNFTSNSLVEPFNYRKEEFQKKKDYFPQLFGAEYGLMLKEALSGIDGELELLEVAYKESKGPARRLIGGKIQGLKMSRNSMASLMELVISDDAADNFGQQSLSRTASKYAKHVSNAFDPLKARRDREVPFDYFKYTMGNIADNTLTVQLLKSLRLSKDFPGVQQAIIALHKRTLGHEDARSQVFGFETSDEDTSPSAKALMKSLNNLYTTKIGGLMSPRTNLFGHLQKGISVGKATTFESISLQESYTEQPWFQRLIRDSGITEFSEFYAASIVKELEDAEVEKDGVRELLKGIIEYYEGIDSGENRRTAKSKLEKLFIDVYKREVDWNGLLSRTEAKAWSKKAKREWIKRKTGKLVNFAISREYTMRAAVKNAPPGVINSIKRAGSGSLVAVAQLLKAIPKGSMSDTEIVLRESSFIMTYLGLKNSGIIKNDMRSMTIEERDILITYGRRMTREIFDFGMSSSDGGEVFASQIGKIVSKFSIWKQQKYSADKWMFEDLYLSLKDHKIIGLDVQAYARMMFQKKGVPFGKSHETLKTTHPDAARVQALMWSQWLVQFIIDAFPVAMELAGLTSARIITSKFLAKTVGMRKGNPLGSSHASLKMMLPVLFMAFMSGNLDEDEDWFKAFTYYFRQIPQFGMGASIISDLVLLAANYNNEKMRYELIKRLMQSNIPGTSGVVGGGVELLIDPILKPKSRSARREKYRVNY